MPHFQIVTIDGESLGSFEIKPAISSEGAGWPIKTVVDCGEHGHLRVVDSIPAKNPEEFTVLMVEPA